MPAEYLFEWITPPGSSPRILLVGDIFMYEARLALEPILAEAIDSIAGNTPLVTRLNHLYRILNRHQYDTVVLGESRHQGKIDATCLPALQKQYPRTRFLLATAPPAYMLSARYRTPCTGQQKRHATVLAQAKEMGIPCISFDACCCQAGIQHPLAAWCTHASHALQNLIRKEKWPLGRDFVRQQLIGSLRDQLETCSGIHPVPPHQVLCNRNSNIAWVNRIHMGNAPILCLGDSNMYRFRLAHPWLASHSDLHSSTLNTLSDEAEEEISRALRPSHHSIILSLGVHHLEEATRPDFEQRCTNLLQRLKSKGRHLILVATSPCMRENDLSQPDEMRNELICQQNQRLEQIARQQHLLFADLYSIMSKGRHMDPVHFSRRSYRPAAALLVHLLKS